MLTSNPSPAAEAAASNTSSSQPQPSSTDSESLRPSSQSPAELMARSVAHRIAFNAYPLSLFMGSVTWTEATLLPYLWQIQKDSDEIKGIMGRIKDMKRDVGEHKEDIHKPTRRSGWVW